MQVMTLTTSLRHALPRRCSRAFPLLNSLPVKPILKMLLKVLDHTGRQRRVNLARAVDAANPRQIHRPAAFGSARAWRWWLGRSDNGVCGY